MGVIIRKAGSSWVLTGNWGEAILCHVFLRVKRNGARVIIRSFLSNSVSELQSLCHN